MTDDELVKYIFGQGPWFCPALSRWMRSCERFRTFVEKHKERIRDKVTEAQRDPEPDERLKDLLFELKMAYLMLKVVRFSEVEYEFYEDGPDYTVVDETSGPFNVEVKRIRKTREEKRLEMWRAQVAREIRRIPSSLAVAINIGLYIDKIDELLDLLARLEDKKLQVIDDITTNIRRDEDNVSTDKVRRYKVREFEGEVELVLRKPAASTPTHTSFDGGILPLFITQQEWRQFKDLIFPKRDQRIPGKINILAIGTDSATHDGYALMEELRSDFEERVAQANITEQMKKLSGVLFRGAWGNLFWSNSTVGYCLVPADIAKVLKEMD